MVTGCLRHEAPVVGGQLPLEVCRSGLLVGDATIGESGGFASSWVVGVSVFRGGQLVAVRQISRMRWIRDTWNEPEMVPFTMASALGRVEQEEIPVTTGRLVFGFVALALVTPVLLGASACSGGGDDGDGNGRASGAGGQVTGSVDLGNQGANSGSGATGGGNGKAEVCNGIDDDENGVVDDLDVGGDGVCDCLAIGTLGIPGTWGAGDVFDTWLNARAAEGAVALGAGELTAELLAPLQVIVAQNLSENGRAYSSAEVEALKGWIEAGGGFITLIGFSDSSERANVNALLEPYDVSYGSEQILEKGGSASTVPITEWFTHPTTENVVLVGVDNGYAVLGEGTVVAREQGYDVGHALEVGLGKILVWGDEWITYNSEWVDHSDYQVERFWLNVLKWSTPAKECQVPLPPFESPK